MQLGADAVVLVLDPRLLPDAAHHLGGVGHRCGKHEPDRAANVERRLREAIFARQRGRFARLGDEHEGPPNVGDRSSEGGSDRLLEQSLAQSDDVGK